MYYCLALQRAIEQGTPPPDQDISIPRVSRWLMSRPDALDEDQRVALKALLARCPHLARVHERIRSFTDLLTQGYAERIEAWITEVKGDGIPAMTSYATGLADDIDAVRAGVGMPHNSGMIEGRVTDLKLIKGQMSGRAGLPLAQELGMAAVAVEYRLAPEYSDPAPVEDCYAGCCGQPSTPPSWV